MIGFEISINCVKKSIGLENGIVSVIVSRVNSNGQNAIDLDCGGYDSSSETNYKWIKENLKVGDKIVLEVNEIEISSEPIKVVKQDSVAVLNEGKLRAYKSLKVDLENAGLI